MDYALNFRRALIDSATTQATQNISIDAAQKRLQAGLDAKRIRAINTLGKRWVFHPEYRLANNPHHSPSHKHSAVLATFSWFRSKGAI